MREPRLRIDGRIREVGDLKQITLHKGTDKERLAPCRVIRIYETSWNSKTGETEFINTQINLLDKTAEKFDLKEKDAVSFSVSELKSSVYEKDGEKRVAYYAYSNFYTSIQKEFNLEPRVKKEVAEEVSVQDETPVVESAPSMQPEVRETYEESMDWGSGDVGF